MAYISDIITREEFLSWGLGQRIFITAATGTGKSFFILHELLIKRAIKRGERILYLVNRKILQDQLIADIESDIWDRARERYGDMINIKNHIQVMTYQNVERNIRHDLYMIKKHIDRFDIVVYDEAHYIYTDSNFNQYTEVSYDFIRRSFDDKIQIFISATMEKVRSCIEGYDKKYFLKELYYMRGRTEGDQQPLVRYPMCRYEERNPKDKEFSVEQDYSYIRLNVFDTYEKLADIICENMKGKWLIFADSIEKGESLKKQISEKTQETTDIVFVDSQIKYQEDSDEAVEDIIKYKKSKKGILIVTSVMNNGISIIDDELKNIAILYDTKEEFIQMLGRKRRTNGSDDECVNLYICKRDRRHFRSRRESVKRKLRFYYRHQNNIESMYKWQVYNRSCPEECRDNKCDHMYDVTPIFELLYKNNYLTSDDLISIYTHDRPYLQRNVLAEILEKRSNDQIFYSLNGFIAVNYFSVNRLINLERFYHDMETKMEDDEYAFVREQMKWMGMECDDIDENISDTERRLSEQYSNILRENIEQIVDIEFDTEENKRLKKEIADAMIFFLCRDKEDKEKKNIRDNFKKNDRGISQGHFNECMVNAGLPYVMTKPSKKSFLVSKSEE